MSGSPPASSSPADEATLDRAAALLRAGGVVAFPTETVYGLAADATNERAVRRVFDIKGRPLAHPVIVHLSDASQLEQWARSIPPAARALADRFWPGPLTMVLLRTQRARDFVTGGQDTVALRVPSHPVAHAVLQRAGIGVIAPSANRFGGPSATRAEHVVADFGEAVDLIVDGGPSTLGVESTIVDLTHDAPRILRPGGVTREQLEDALGIDVPVVTDASVRVSGSLPSHYAPRASVELFEDERAARVRFDALIERGTRAALLVGTRDVESFARDLYERLRAADKEGAEAIVVAMPEEGGLGTALRDRLRRAAAPRANQGT